MYIIPQIPGPAGIDDAGLEVYYARWFGAEDLELQTWLVDLLLHCLELTKMELLTVRIVQNFSLVLELCWC